MKITKDDLTFVSDQGIITEQQATKIWDILTAQKKDSPKFDVIHVAYYLGTFIIMSAMGWFMNDAWNRFGGGALAAIAIVYGLLFAFVGRHFWFSVNLKVPGGLLFTLAVWMTPLAIFGFEKMIGWWPQDEPGLYRDYFQWVKGGWFLMEVGTIIAGLISLRFIKFPFLTFPISFTLWFMSMDIIPLFFSGGQHSYWETRILVSLYFGLIILGATYFIDRRTKADFAFWGYLFGLLAFWGGLSLLESTSESNKFIYCLINLCLILISILFKRKVFIVFGAFGVFGYLGHLAREVFADSLLLPLALTGIGCIIIYSGIQYQRNSKKIEEKFAMVIPDGIHKLLPPYRSYRDRE